MAQFKYIMVSLTTSHVSYTHMIISGIGISKQYCLTVKEIITMQSSIEQYGLQTRIKEKISWHINERYCETANKGNK